MCSRAELPAALLVALLTLAPGCTAEEPHARDGSGDAVLVEDSAAPETGSRSRLALGAPARDAFPHDRHVGLECARCHARLPGHDTHASLGCSACHGPVSADPIVIEAARQDCSSCHHASTRQVGCGHCHEDLAAPPDRPVTVQARFSTSGLVVRRLPFRHAPHTPVECTRCHGPGAGASTGGACAGCHDAHHVPAASCSGCHPDPASGVHDVDSHAGCGSAGCHDDPAVIRLPLTRSVCLACHREHSAHEAGAECSTCHPVQPAVSARAQEASR